MGSYISLTKYTCNSETKLILQVLNVDNCIFNIYLRPFNIHDIHLIFSQLVYRSFWELFCLHLMNMSLKCIFLQALNQHLIQIMALVIVW